MKRVIGSSIFAIFAILILMVSCKGKSDVLESNLENMLNKEISLEKFETVQRGGNSYSWSDFRQKFSNISIVFLQDGCTPCYPKFIEWHKRMEQISTADDYTVLFVLNARHYENFVRNARTYGEFDERYFHVMDPDNRFMMDNLSIPRNIIDRSLLIDSRNRIKMIGEPFANADMTKVFHIVTGVDTQHTGESK